MRELMNTINEIEEKLFIVRLKREGVCVNRCVTLEREVPVVESEFPIKRISYRVSATTRNGIDLEFEFPSDYDDGNGYYVSFPDAFASAVYGFSMDLWEKERVSTTKADIDDVEDLLERLKQILHELSVIRNQITDYLLGCLKLSGDE